MVLAALLLAVFLVNLDTARVNVALPALVRQLHATTTQLRWVVDSFSLVFAALLLTAGSLSGRFGRKAMLVAGRRERARAIGLWGAIAGVAIAMGPVVGGWLLEHVSWASIFTAMAPVAAPPDIPGLVLSSAAMALLVFTIIEAPACGWGAGRSLAGLAASALLLPAFIARERSAAHPMLDVRLFRNMRFSAASGAVTVSFFTLSGFIFLITQYFQVIRGYGPLPAGVRLLPVALPAGAGPVAGTALAVRAWA
jgi:MFS family permease